MGVILFFVALFLSIILAVPAVFASMVILIINACKFRFIYTFTKHTNDMFLQGGIAIDVFGNVFFKHLFNWALITDYSYMDKNYRMATANYGTKVKKQKYPFGKQGETISSVLGKNQREMTLTKTGLLLALLLDTIDPNHCFKSIKND